WYQGDIETDDAGHGRQRFIGRFSIETFIVAQPPSDSAPVIHDQPPFPDAASNPTTEPVHTFHLGLWFNSPADAAAAARPTPPPPPRPRPAVRGRSPASMATTPRAYRC